MYKVLHNNMVIDLLEQANYVRFIKTARRWILTDVQNAHGIMGSDKNTIYHLQGAEKPLDTLTSVIVIPIDEEEYKSLASQKGENKELREEITTLKEQLAQQRALLEKLLEKIQ